MSVDADHPELNSDEEDGKLYEGDKEGYLHVKRKKKTTKFKLYWCTLVGSTLFLYEHPSNREPKLSLQLQHAEIIEPDPVEKKPFSWLLHCEEEVSFHAEKEDELTSWLTALRSAVNLPSSPRPNKEGVIEKSSSFIFKTKKHISGRLVTSSLMGKSTMKKIFPDEVNDIISVLESLLTKKVSQEKAKETTKVITHTLIKGHFQVEKKTLDYDQVMLCYKPLREAFELLVKIHDGYPRLKKQNSQLLVTYFNRVENLFKKEEEQVTKLMSMFMKAENIISLRAVFEVVGSAKFWLSVFDDDATRESDEVIELCIAMNKLSSFHVHKPRNRANTTRF